MGDGPLLLIGSGAELLAKEARASGVMHKIVSAQASPDIAYVARLGLAANPETAPARPLYLKEPDVTVAGKPQEAAAPPDAPPAETLASEPMQA
jgi:hypothetical protein